VVINLENSHIDHIVPLAQARTITDVISLNQLNNLRLICSKCNLKKGAKMDSTMTVEKSTHKAEVIRIKEILKHPNADSLGIVKIYDYSCCIRLGDFKEGDLAAYICPDNEVDTTRPEFAFLAPKKAEDNPRVRIRTKKLRGFISYGLLAPAPVGSKVGDNVAEILGITHWEPALNCSSSVTGGEAAKPPSGVFPCYDVDTFLTWGRQVFKEGEKIVVTEKMNGCNGRYVFKDGVQHCGSRGEFKKEYPTKPSTTLEDLIKQYDGDTERAKNSFRRIENWNPPKNLWWIAYDNTPAIKDFCQANPGFALYGEVYGAVGGWAYDVRNGKYAFRAFDILTPDSTWLDALDFLDTCKKYSVPTVPVLHEAFPFEFDKVVKLAEGKSTFGDFISEGVVICPQKERWDERVGRVKFKIINPEY
jgi:RNA ligase (TIGR02306 family)